MAYPDMNNMKSPGGDHGAHADCVPAEGDGMVGADAQTKGNKAVKQGAREYMGGPIGDVANMAR